MVTIKNKVTGIVIMELADLRDADLRGADLSGADLRGADLRDADLRDADLRDADLRDADLRDADLSGADLRGADLSGADLRGADLTRCDLSGADLDFSAMPLWCGDLEAGYDDKQVIQQLYHVLSHARHSPNASTRLKQALLTPELVSLANEFHRVGECDGPEALKPEAGND